MVLGWLIAYWWLMLIESVVIAGIIGVLVLSAPKIVGKEPTSLGALRSGMLVTAIATVLAYFALMIGIANYLGAGGESLVIMAAIFSAALIIVQWMISPWIIGLVYRTRDPVSSREKMIANTVQRIAERSGVSNVKVKIADISMPNAFAYSSPLAGKHIAITKGLMNLLDDDELEAVAAHEVGHLKHRDVSWILALSIIPLMVYFLGRILIYAGLLGGGGRRREESSPLLLAAIGAALLAMSIIFRFLIAHFNRLREYYADAHSALTTGKPRALQRALAKIYVAVKKGRFEAEKHSLAAPLFIIAPLIDVNGGLLVSIDDIVETLKREEESPIIELFSTHPPISKRLRFLDRMAESLWGEL